MFKLTSLVAIALAALTAVPGSAADTTSEAAFDRLKSLVGEWRGEHGDGQVSRKIYKLTANGQALAEEYNRLDRDDYDMLTVYHLNGDDLMLTHYCIAGNQPRMVSETSGDPDTLVFSFHDASGIDQPGEAHIHRVVFRFRGEERMAQKWIIRKDGEDQLTEAVEYVRIH